MKTEHIRVRDIMYEALADGANPVIRAECLPCRDQVLKSKWRRQLRASIEHCAEELLAIIAKYNSVIEGADDE